MDLVALLLDLLPKTRYSSRELRQGNTKEKPYREDVTALLAVLLPPSKIAMDGTA
jgi:hypothetical protein